MHKQMNEVGKVAAAAKQTGHGVTNKSPHPKEQRENVAQAAQHNRDMDRIETMHQRGFKK